MDEVVGAARSNASRKVSLVPARSPLAMPTQSLGEWNGAVASKRRHSLANSVNLARWFVFSVTAGLTGFASWEMYNVVGQSQATSLQIVLVALFALTFFWIALAGAKRQEGPEADF